MTIIHKTLVCLVVAACCASCESEPEAQDPDDVFMSFLTHYFRGEPEIAFGFVAPEDREALQKPLAGAPPQSEPLEPWEMLVVAEVENVYDVAKVEVSEKFEGPVPEGKIVTLTIHRTDGSQASAQMVQRAGRWYVDLPLETSAKPLGKQG